MDKSLRRIVFDSICTYKDGRLASYKDNVKGEPTSDSVHSNWKRVPFDMVWDNPYAWDKFFSDGADYHYLTGIFTYSINHHNHKVVRYKYLEYLFSVIEGMIKHSEFYTLCKNNGALAWVKKEVEEEDIYGYFLDGYFGFKDELPATDTVNVINKKTFDAMDKSTLGNGDSYAVVNHQGDLYPNVGFKTWAGYRHIGDTAKTEWVDVICVNPLSTEYVKLFIRNGYDYAKLLFKYAEHIFNDTILNYGSRIDVPYMDCYVTIQSDFDNLGIYTPYIEQWVAGKKYYKGDQVVYDNRLYELVYCPDGWYSGEYDKTTGVISFDDDNNSHWALRMEYGGVIEDLEGQTSSYIQDFYRYRISADDSGNTLPFVVIEDSATVYTGKTQMRYMLGLNKFVYVDDKTYTNVIDAVSFYDEDSNMLVKYEYDTERQSTPLLNGMVPITTDDIPQGTKFVKFEYTQGAVLVKNSGSTITEGSGVSYEEVYPCVIDTYSTTYNKKDLQFKYANIEYGSGCLFDADSGFVSQNKSLSVFKLSKDGDFRDKFMNARIFFEEPMLGLIDRKESIELEIERNSGDATAYEKHSVLSEVNTFEDLVNYRNNLFNID